MIDTSYEFIKTKLIVEVSPARFFSLGFGDISNSEANVVCVSSFVEDMEQIIDYFLATSTALFDVETSVARTDYPLDQIKIGWPYIFALPDVEYGFRRLLVICKGSYEQPTGTILNNIRVGLARSIALIGKLEIGLQIDMTAMGVGPKHGGISSKVVFDALSQWITDLFTRCENVDHLRLVTNVPDTFVDLFESLQKFRELSSDLPFTASISPGSYGEFSDDISAASHLLYSNPKQVIVICRTIIESVVRRLCFKHMKRPPTKLYKDISDLRNRDVIPAHILSFLHTCRVLGNFSNHSDFAPTERDAEAVMLLTLRVVEWFLESSP